MAKSVKVAMVLALSVVVCVSSLFIYVSGARDIDNSPAEAPWVDPLPKQCRITGPCREFVADLIWSESLPSKKDVACCQEIVQTTKYCWETIMDILEDPIIPPFANLHPWTENAWNKCVILTDSAAQAPMLSDNSPTQAPTLPAQCKISKMCGNNLAQIIVAKTLPTVKDFTCCKEIVQSTKYCWDKAMEIVEDPNVPALAHLHPWAENFWSDCVDITTEKIVPQH